MGHIDNDKFAEIALSLGFCTPDQVRRCLGIQRDTTEHLSLGQSLLREGFISGEQHSQVLKRLRSSQKDSSRGSGDQLPPATGGMPARPAAPTAEDREDELLGKLAVREGWLTAPELSGLRAKVTGPPRRTLADVLVSEGHLTAARAEELLGRVSRRAMCCRSCQKAYTVLSIVGSPEVACPGCRGPLHEGRLPDRPPAKDPLSTQTFEIVSKSFKRPLGARARNRGR